MRRQVQSSRALGHGCRGLKQPRALTEHTSLSRKSLPHHDRVIFGDFLRFALEPIAGSACCAFNSNLRHWSCDGKRAQLHVYRSGPTPRGCCLTGLCPRLLTRSAPLSCRWPRTSFLARAAQAAEGADGGGARDLGERRPSARLARLAWARAGCHWCRSPTSSSSTTGLRSAALSSCLLSRPISSPFRTTSSSSSSRGGARAAAATPDATARRRRRRPGGGGGQAAGGDGNSHISRAAALGAHLRRNKAAMAAEAA